MHSSFLIIQTAFLGDVILATSLAEKLHGKFPAASIDMLVRRGCESLLTGHPFIREVFILDKEKKKFPNLLNTALLTRKKKYDVVVNLHRFGSSGFITWLSAAKEKYGFDKNPFAFCYTKKIKHEIGNGKHETERNHELIVHLTGSKAPMPKLYPSQPDREMINKLLSGFSVDKYICIAPASLWFTKQYPKDKWIELIHSFETNSSVFLIGGKADVVLCEEIKNEIENNPTAGSKINIFNLAGKISLLQTAALMQNAFMNYVNDSAPLHMASSVNAPVTAIFCSTVPDFGFGPLSTNSKIVQVKERLRCRPCGLHGFKTCPENNFLCAQTIKPEDILHG